MKNLKKAFTLTELVIVIAVIAILAAVLIPTYTSLVREANITHDQKNATTFNEKIRNSTNVTFNNMNDVFDVILSGGYDIAKMNPATSNHRYVCDMSGELPQILFVNEKFEVQFPADGFSKDKSDWWLPVNKSSELSADILKQGMNLFFTSSLTSSLTLDKLVSIEVWDNVTYAGNITYNTQADDSATINGKFSGTITINAPKAHIEQEGTANIVNIQAVSNSTWIGDNFFANEIILGSDAQSVKFSNNTNIKTLNLQASSYTNVTIENNGIINNVKTGATTADGAAKLPANVNLTSTNGIISTDVVTNSEEEITTATTKDIDINDLQGLLNFQQAVNSGSNYKGVTVNLTNNINISNIEWTPIGIGNVGFAGIFNGANFDIQGLTMTEVTVEKGFKYNEATENTSSSVIAGYATRYSFGFFGGIQGGQVKDVDFTNVSITFDAQHVVNEYTYFGVVAGYLQDTYEGTRDATGKLNADVSTEATNKALIQNVTVDGKIDACGRLAGIVGWMDSGKISNATNNINIVSHKFNTAIQSYSEAAGIVSWIRNSSANVDSKVVDNTGSTFVVRGIEVTNCVNNGNLVADGMRIGGIITASNDSYLTNEIVGSAEIVISNCTNKGTLESKDNTSKGVKVGYIIGDCDGMIVNNIAKHTNGCNNTATSIKIVTGKTNSSATYFYATASATMANK